MTSASHYFALPRGFTLFEFRIEAVLGHGGFGITYRSTDTLLQETVALKEYLPGGLAVRTAGSTVQPKSSNLRSDFEVGLNSFLTEARIMARFRHPRIVFVRRFFEYNGTAYIVSDYERGQTLGDRLRAGPLPESELRVVLFGALDALEVLHNRAILHRDLKPTNIMLRADGDPVVIDFGAARDFQMRHGNTITAIVTEGYSPPEQYGLGGDQGPWSDLYALGAIAYRCVTGITPPDSRRRLRHDPLISAQIAAAGNYDEPLLRAIDWMLRIDENERPFSVQQVRDALRGGSIPIIDVTPPSPSDEVSTAGQVNTQAEPQDLPAEESPVDDIAEPSQAVSQESDQPVSLRRVVPLSGSSTMLEFDRPIDADVLELAFQVTPPALYLAPGHDGAPEWRRTAYYFSLIRADVESNSAFEASSHISSHIPTGSIVTVSSNDGYIRATARWGESRDSQLRRQKVWIIAAALLLIVISTAFYWSFRS